MEERFPFLKCGHRAIATVTRAGVTSPACPVCLPRPEATQVAEPPGVVGRVMRCNECGRERASDSRAAYYQHRDTGDVFYCGCRGWD